MHSTSANHPSSQPTPDEVSDASFDKFVAMLQDFIVGLKARNGGYAKIEIEVAAGEIKRFGPVYEPYLLSKSL